MKIEIETKYSIGDIVYAIHYGRYKKFVIDEIHSKVETKNNKSYSTNLYTCSSIDVLGWNDVNNNVTMTFEEYELMTKDKLKEYIETILN